VRVLYAGLGGTPKPGYQTYEKRFVRQVVHLKELYRDVQSTDH